MANTLAIIFRRINPTVCGNFNGILKFIPAQPQAARFLYTKTALGIDGYLQQRERTKQQFANITEKFKEKMNNYTADDSKNMVFTEDLKNMIHLAENDDDFEIAVRMMKKFNAQNKELRFGNFVFGPVIMRMFHHFNKPELAYECFKSSELAGLFDQLMTYQLLLDLLYNNGKYQEVLDACNLIKERQVEGVRYPKNVVVLTLAACYKLNTPESFTFANELWKELQELGQNPLRRASTFYAALALKQGHPGATIEIISNVRNQNYMTVRNLKVAALVLLGKVEEALPVLKSILSEDVAVNKVHTFSREIINEVKAAVEKLDNPDVTLEFERIKGIFEKQRNITDLTLDDQLCAEIERQNVVGNRWDRQPTGTYNRFREQNQRQRPEYRTRPGLEELQ